MATLKHPGKIAKTLAWYRRKAESLRAAGLDSSEYDRYVAAYAVRLRAASCCERCGRGLTDPESIARGIGPECVTKVSGPMAATPQGDSAYANDEAANKAGTATTGGVAQPHAPSSPYTVRPCVDAEFGPGWGVFDGDRPVGRWFADQSFAETWAGVFNNIRSSAVALAAPETTAARRSSGSASGAAGRWTSAVSVATGCSTPQTSNRPGVRPEPARARGESRADRR